MQSIGQFSIHKQRQTLNAAIAVLFFMIIGTSLYIVTKQTNQVDVLGDSTPENVQLAEYTDESRFSFSYPEDWYVDKQTDNLLWIRSGINKFDFLASPKTTEGNAQSAIQFQVRDNALRLDIDDWAGKQKGFPDFTLHEVILDSGLMAYEAETDLEGWKARATYFVVLANQVLQVSFYSNQDEKAEADKPLFLAALNTLALQSQNDDGNHETYQNGIYGYLIDYPTGFIPVNEVYEKGLISFSDVHKELVLEAEFGAERNVYPDLATFVQDRDESSLFKDRKTIELGNFQAIAGTFTADTKNTYYYVKTSRGYYILRIKESLDSAGNHPDIIQSFLDSFRVYEILDASDWARYESADSVFQFLYPADANITNVHNGVEIEIGEQSIGMYAYENKNLTVNEWIDNRQLNKYRGADTRNVIFRVRSQVDGKDALRVVDSVGEYKLVTYVVDVDNAYVIDMKPFDTSNTESIYLFNTILNSLELK